MEHCCHLSLAIYKCVCEASDWSYGLVNQAHVHTMSTSSAPLTHMHSSQPFSLLHLPKDIRLCIYECIPLVTRHAHVKIIQATKMVVKSVSVTLVTTSLSHSILLTCRQVYDEAIHIFRKKQFGIIPRIIIVYDHAAGQSTYHPGTFLGPIIGGIFRGIGSRDCKLAPWMEHATPHEVESDMEKFVKFHPSLNYMIPKDAGSAVGSFVQSGFEASRVQRQRGESAHPFVIEVAVDLRGLHGIMISILFESILAPFRYLQKDFDFSIALAPGAYGAALEQLRNECEKPEECRGEIGNEEWEQFWAEGEKL